MLSVGFDNVKTRLECVIRILEENYDMTDQSRDHSSPSVLRIYHKCLLAMRKLCNIGPTCTVLPVNIPTLMTMSGLPGRPKVVVNLEFFELLKEAGYTLSEIAQILGASRTTLWRRLKENNVCVSRYSEISDHVLDYMVKQFQDRNPNCGLVMLQGHLSSIGINVQRWRIRDSVYRNNPLRQHSWHQRITRRRYCVPSANSLWHIDGHHKLIRWRFVIHGGIDGFSRLIVYLRCSTNNRAATVMTEFYNATTEYRVPSRVRSDKGGENVLVCHYMVTVRGIARGSHIAGSSTRNQRIERLWRDVFRCVASTYHTLFHSMEAIGVLDPDNEVELFVLHCLYLPRINHSLAEFLKAWNRHPLRTEHNWSPCKIWTNSVLSEEELNGILPETDTFGIDEEGPFATEELNTVQVPETLENITEEVRHTFLTQLDTFASTIFIRDADPYIEFLEAKLILSELLESLPDDDENY